MRGARVVRGAGVPLALAPSMAALLTGSLALAEPAAAPAPAPSSGLGQAFADAPKGLAVWAGLGITSQDSGPALGTGSFAMGEYVVQLSPWFAPRVYGGFLFT